jgi:hypothetical protein
MIMPPGRRGPAGGNGGAIMVLAIQVSGRG